MEKINITQESWMNCLKSTGINSSYYTWTGENFYVDGERDDFRIDIFELELPKNFFKNKKVLDIGCNIGRICHYANSKKAKKVYGLEGDFNTYKAACKIQDIENTSEDKIEFIYGDARKDLTSNNQLSNLHIAFCLSVLHHINPREEVFSFLDKNIKEYIIIEAGLKEYPFNSQITSDNDKWEFNNKEEMIQYIESKIPSFKYESEIGISERSRSILLFKKM